jgi:hypothetical protein
MAQWRSISSAAMGASSFGRGGDGPARTYAAQFGSCSVWLLPLTV